MLVFLVMAFVNTFGITQPTPEGARRAARTLGWVLLAMLTVVLAATFGIWQAVYGR